MAELAAMTGGQCLVIEEDDRLQSKVTSVDDGCGQSLFVFTFVYCMRRNFRGLNILCVKFL